VKATRVLPPLLAAATLLLVGANAVPSIQRKHLLEKEGARLASELRHEERIARRLAREVDALARDPFYLERVLVETWSGTPRGATPFVPGPAPDPLVRAE
jgi:hypothetical protein